MEKIEEIRPKKHSIDASCCLSSNSSSATIQEGVIGNNNFQMSSHSKLNRELCISQEDAVNLTFTDVTCTVNSWSLKKGRVPTEILHNVNGEFRAGQLTTIMGPSGAGKSTLLNILAGYTTIGATGKILVNGKPRIQEEFSRQSCYIQQNDSLRDQLTARELMMSTTHLKLGSTTTGKQKIEQVTELLTMLGLDECQDTRCISLSGGQKKRLSIALELISNPPVLFLDEPTTGLDSSSCSQCVMLLKLLAMEGRTIICTLHQPTALIFEMFDHLYSLSNGQCIYQGTSKDLVPYLETFGLHCPQYNNPADFLMDVSMGEYGANLEQLAQAAERNVRPMSRANDAHIKRIISKGDISDEQIHISHPNKKNKKKMSSPASSVWVQFYLLICRNILTIRRDNSRILIRLAAHLVIGLLFGYLYRGVGDDASKVLGNCVFMYGTLLFLVYTGKMAVTLSFPVEFKMLRREHFNHWYSLGPYFLSLILIEIPVQILCTAAYVFISYPLTGQPLEMHRIIPIAIIFVTTSLTSQSFGFLIGIISPIKIAVFIGPVIAVIFSMFGFNIFYRDIPAVFRWLYHVSYFRAAYHGAMFTLYDNRTTLPCSEYYCHFKFPSKFLQDMDITDVNVAYNTSFVVAWGLCLYVLTLIAVWYRLNRR